ncbi:MAG TPA: YlxR family protein [Erysipelotrichaceae bacterium]|nr:YlxR family protein [Erysipelotrichia bacterium]HPX33395.1 YlxR family protein [Erysipelotrichaceae bacterium]HQA85425.1 YlxR family protein [Erysipelotrichaceae bacterium]
MKKRKIPMRKCIITNERFPKKELIRVVRTPENEVVVDLSGKMNGRGAYLKKDKEVFTLARSKNLLAKQLECEVKETVYDELDSLL